MATRVGWPCWMTVAFLLCEGSTLDSQKLLTRPDVTNDGLALVHHSFALHCLHFDERTAYREVNYTWYKDDVFVESQTSPSLSFPNVTRKDGGTYTCKVSDGNSRAASLESKPFSMHVIFSPEVHIETPTDKPVIKAVLGESLTLTCVVTAAFPPVFTDSFCWSYSPLPQGPRRPLAGKASTLTLGPLTREDSGQYFCQARNDFQFKGKILPGNASVTVDVVCPPSLKQAEDVTSEVSGIVGGRLTLTLPVEGHPPPSFSWSGPVIGERETRTDSLTLVHLQEDHTGNYTVNVSNAHGFLVHRFYVDVKREADTSVKAPHETLSGDSSKQEHYTYLLVGLAAVVLGILTVTLTVLGRRLKRRCTKPRTRDIELPYDGVYSEEYGDGSEQGGSDEEEQGEASISGESTEPYCSIHSEDLAWLPDRSQPWILKEGVWEENHTYSRPVLPPLPLPSSWSLSDQSQPGDRESSDADVYLNPVFPCAGNMSESRQEPGDESSVESLLQSKRRPLKSRSQPSTQTTPRSAGDRASETERLIPRENCKAKTTAQNWNGEQEGDHAYSRPAQPPRPVSTSRRPSDKSPSADGETSHTCEGNTPAPLPGATTQQSLPQSTPRPHHLRRKRSTQTKSHSSGNEASENDGMTPRKNSKFKASAENRNDQKATASETSNLPRASRFTEKDTYTICETEDAGGIPSLQEEASSQSVAGRLQSLEDAALETSSLPQRQPSTESRASRVCGTEGGGSSTRALQGRAAPTSARSSGDLGAELLETAV